MNTDNFITAIEKFFFEIIGQLLPGILFIAGLYFLFPESSSDYVPTSPLNTWVLIGVAYAAGGGLTAIGSYFFVPAYVWLFNSSCIIKKILPTKVLKMLQSNDQFDEALEKYQGVKYLKLKYPGITSLRSLRNIAMSSIAQDDKETVVRFMFLSLLSQGVATAIFLLSISKIIFLLFNENFNTILVFSCIALFVSSLLLCLPFILREREFYDRARRLPIYCYIAVKGSEEQQNNNQASPRKTVYLAGGHHSNWQQNVIRDVSGFEYKDPSSHGLTNPQEYTNWDLEAIRNSDIVFAYLEATNPSGYGLSLEVGYAAALGKLIIFINEKSSTDPISAYLGMLRETAQVNFVNLEDGIDYLNSLT